MRSRRTLLQQLAMDVYGIPRTAVPAKLFGPRYIRHADHHIIPFTNRSASRHIPAIGENPAQGGPPRRSQTADRRAFALYQLMDFSYETMLRSNDAKVGRKPSICSELTSPISLSFR
jgi:hypothetical protein